MLAYAANEPEFQLQARYFMLRLNLIVKGISLDEVEAIFSACVPAFVIRSATFTARDCCISVLIRENNYVNRVMAARVMFYAQKWVESPIGVQYKSLHELHR